MLHGALFYLWNCNGGMFEANKSEDWVKLVALTDFLHYSERQELRYVIDIALQYHEIEHFRNKVANRHTIQYENNLNGSKMKSSDTSSDIQQGIYLEAFCSGLNEVLADYRKDSVILEEGILKNPNLTLVDIKACMKKYVTLFTTLKSIIRKIETSKVHGSLLVGCLHINLDSGIDIVTNANLKLIRSVNTMFFHHLCNWIMYGDLVDVYNEFFISDAKCVDENFLYTEQMMDSSSNSHLTLCLSKKQKLKRPAEVRKFVIRHELLPSVIPIEIAETILFMGRIVWIVRNDPNKSLDENCQIKFRRDIWEGKDVEYSQKIKALESEPLEVSKFTKTIEICRLKLTKYLWTIMVNEAKLLEHLQLIRDYYGLGRGELFQQFIVAAEEQLINTYSDHIVANLNFIFKDTARKMYGEHDKTFKRFELTVAKPNDNLEAAKPWTLIEINFDIYWPLHIIFHPKAMSLYNKLFCFLLRVKKTHVDLHKLWQIHMAGKEKIDTEVWTLRHNLMFLVSNIQYYLQVDVIEAQFSLLKNAVKNANEFEDVIRLHSKFLSNLLSQTFVMSISKESQTEQKHCLYQHPILNDHDKNSVYKIILILLELCDEFCSRASLWGTELLEPHRIDLERYRKRTDSLVQTLLKVLFSLHEQATGPHLLQLLHRLDFNRWYSKKNDLNITTSKNF